MAGELWAALSWGKERWRMFIGKTRCEEAGGASECIAAVGVGLTLNSPFFGLVPSSHSSCFLPAELRPRSTASRALLSSSTRSPLQGGGLLCL